ncbi:MAG TPA: 1-deoxy-D-xylulose-5-phosphate synthase, partial [Clostridia bacterium]|nr:1-deoxy-D-xylulose-5-phosphate synthase [Clostridia bacterium]
TLRKYNGLSGYPKPAESTYDCFATGHSSTSISAALGLARSRDLKGEDYNIIAVIGDGALGGGMAFEAMNDLGINHEKMLVILNDNKMSISANVGGISEYLAALRVRPNYMKFKKTFENLLRSIPCIGNRFADCIKDMKDRIRRFITGTTLFDDIGIRYIGPIDGNDIEHLIEVLKNIKNDRYSTVLHIITQKGKGFARAEEDPEKYHGLAPYIVESKTHINGRMSFTEAFSKSLVELASADDRIVAITAAMPKGTGLDAFANLFPKRFFNVGIAEQHAATLAAGFAAGGLKPVFSVYSTFIQRAYDQIVHDICLQNLPVILAIDRAGLVGEDGETHQGIFDISFLRAIPNMHIFAPKNSSEMNEMLKLALEINAPCAIRYPKDKIKLPESNHFEPFKWQKLISGEDCAILAFGRMLDIACESARILDKSNIKASVYNSCFIKPLDMETLSQIFNEYKYIFTLEDSIIAGGFGVSIIEAANESGYTGKLFTYGIDDSFIKQGTVAELLAELRLDAQSIAQRIAEALK